MPKLLVKNGEKKGLAFRLTDREVTLGRDAANTIVLPDRRVSRHHGQILGRRGTLIYLDLGSTNGSNVNGEPVSEVVLGVGDRLEVGDTTLVLEVAEAPD